MSWKELQGPAQHLARAIGRAVAAAANRDRDAYEPAAGALAALQAEQSGLVLGALVRSILEDQHPDGMDGDDIQAVLSRCYLQAAGWLSPGQVDPHTLLAVLASALGIHEPGVTYEEITAPPAARKEADDWVGDPVGGYVHGGGSTAIVPSLVPTGAAYAWHAPLLIADLVATGRRGFDGYLDAAFTEIARAETMELP